MYPWTLYVLILKEINYEKAIFISMRIGCIHIACNGR